MMKWSAGVGLVALAFLGLAAHANAALMFTTHLAEVQDPDDGQSFQTPC